MHAGSNLAGIDFVRGIEPQTLERLEKLSDQEPLGIVAVCDDLDPRRAEGTELDYYQGVITPEAATGGTTVLPVPAGIWAAGGVPPSSPATSHAPRCPTPRPSRPGRRRCWTG